MKPVEKRKHHYVPQFLLRNFAAEKREILYAFDKSNDKEFQISVTDAAAERGFNSFEIDERDGCAEDFFTDLENFASPIIDRIVRERKLSSVTGSDRTILIRFAVAQMIRSKNQRAIVDQVGAFVRNMAETEGTPEFQAWVGPDDAEETKAILLLNIEDTVHRFSIAMNDKDIMLYSVVNGTPLLIGDNPLIRMNSTNKSSLMGTLGIASRGVEIYLPLSPTLVLAFMCPSIRLMLEDAVRKLGRDAGPTAIDYLFAIERRKPVELEAPHILFMNSQQAFYAERFVYSSTDDFTVVKEMIKENSSLRNGPRLKIN